MIPPQGKTDRPRELDMRDLVDAIQYMLGTGCQWRAVPECFPAAASIRNCFYAWRDTGVPERMPDALRTLAHGACWPFGAADGGRDCQPAGQDRRERRPVRIRCGKERQG